MRRGARKRMKIIEISPIFGIKKKWVFPSLQQFCRLDQSSGNESKSFSLKGIFDLSASLNNLFDILGSRKAIGGVSLNSAS
jgi:hypothetical protein